MRNTLLTLLVSLALGAAMQAQTYTESIVYAFGSTTINDGATPNALVMDSAGNLYGTTLFGGGSVNCFEGCGMVFKVSPGGQETILHVFTNNSDGAFPFAGLAIDSAGNLYGTTNGGGVNGNGTVFKITAAGKYSILHKFGRVAGDGLYPFGPVTLDSSGNIYGTTQQGGSTNNDCVGNGSNGCGTIFKLTPKGSESIIYKFTGTGSDQGFPDTNLLRDGQGNLYGNNISSVLFKVTSSGVETTLHTFGTDFLLDGSYTARDSSGNFYGQFIGPNDTSAGIWKVTGAGVETDFDLCTTCTSSSPGGFQFGGPLLLN